MHRHFMLALSLSTTFLASTPLFPSSPENTSVKKDQKILLLSQQRSGTNLITWSLAAILRKPVVYFPNSVFTNSPEYIGLNLTSTKPLVYRCHANITPQRAAKYQIDTMVFLSRNPKELLYKLYPNIENIGINHKAPKSFIKTYISRFHNFERWPSSRRTLLFYEDVISNFDQTLINLVALLNPSSEIFLEDFFSNKESYLNKIHKEYRREHSHEHNGLHGISRVNKPDALYYTRGKDPELLKSIDRYIAENYPYIWKKYLKRFETP